MQQTIRIGLESGAIDLEHVAIDGSLLPGFAGSNSFKSPEYMAEHLARLERSVSEDIDADESENDNPDDDLPKLPKALEDRKELTRRVREELKRHTKDGATKVSITDSDCKQTRKGPADNMQAAVDEHSRMVVGGYATNTTTDSGELVPVLQDVKARTGLLPARLTADGGYKAFRGLAYMASKGIEGFVPQTRPRCSEFALTDFAYHDDTDTFTCPNGRTLEFQSTVIKPFHTARLYKAQVPCTDCSIKGRCLRRSKTGKVPYHRYILVSDRQDLVMQMEQRVATELGKIMRKKRSSTVETLFGHLKYIRNFTRMRFIGLDMVNAMWLFELATYNIERLIGFKRMASAV